MKEQRNPRSFLQLIMISATFGGLLFGYDTGVINGALPFMARSDQLNLTPVTEGLVTSMLLLGAAFGALLCGKLADRYGRRKMILNLSFLFFLASLGTAIAPNVLTMVIFRFLLGLAVGGASSMVPAFLAEMAPYEKRGRMVTQNELMIVGGQFLAYVFNAILGVAMADTGHVWRYMLVLCAIPALLLFASMLMVPESPRWLTSKGKKSEALRVLKLIRDEKRAEAEFKEIQAAAVKDSNVEKVSIKEFSTPWLRRLLWIGIGVAIVNQITGVNSIMYYGTQILQESGFGTKAALIANIGNGLISVIAVIIGIWLVGRVNRRPILMIGLSGTTTALLFIAIFSIVFDGSAALPYIVLSLTVLFLAFMQGCVGPVTWLVIAEIFPQKVRGLGSGISVFFLWILNFIIGFAFPIMLSSAGLSFTFFIFVALGILAIGFVYKFMPETKGRTLEELEEHFRSMDRNYDSEKSIHEA
ncbi:MULTISPECIES: sugar porter family MFS transporter [Bacillus]|uniref:Sugar porter family MFS transporter n=1 Tax=Bacillus halotolerans TaxID=260554 RepID=A0A9Q4EHS6_9BACI|nr:MULTISPECIES: sugar porter family MFS transporter [Bacillus]MCY8474449.1 sugar porter family MFS transporter [Bacillus halotolerans]MCY9184081.1 sugar porter family MFS transporter [Bacillus halotolerans]MCY9199646.1 sugar porter family MFS transporter [Bacillus halotolerans]QNH38089.1 sugar porter family MFS transporter [Bacillus sp. PAMC26543]UTL78601.1 sugar porter family MFS transporter [Bacillus halotolerans]